MSTEKKFKLEFYPCLGQEPTHVSHYDTAHDAEAALNAIANYTLHLHERELMDDYSNVGMVFELDEDGGWVEIDGDGEEI